MLLQNILDHHMYFDEIKLPNVTAWYDWNFVV